MPITAKLSRGFYERFGDEIVNELVEWLNTVDTSYRQEFKDLFEANFGRLEERFVEFERRIEEMERGLEARMDAKLERMKSELLRWLFVFWVGTMGTVIALMKL